MKQLTAFIPNLITMLNLMCGVLASIFALEGDLGKAAIFIFIAAVFDFLDGFAARLLKAYSDIGKELDSLADVVSFGVAPAFIMLTLMKIALFGENVRFNQISPDWFEWVLLFSALLIPVFSAYRLAKFNTDLRQTLNFIGLPTPANAILWASFALMAGYSANDDLLRILFTSRNLLSFAIITSLLLVSNIPMFSLKFTGTGMAENWHRYSFLLAALVLIIFAGIFSPALIIVLYISLSISFYLMRVNI
jgi:CDP-diacylglycerol--serine O-phosphatidyltransferase